MPDSMPAASPEAMSATSTPYIVGVDLGGTNIVVGAAPLDGREISAVRTEPTRAEEGADGVTARIVRMVEETIAETMAAHGISRARFAGVGIGAPGPLDRETGVVLITPNLGWMNFPLGIGCPPRSGCPQRSTTTPTARHSASGGSVPRAARST